MSRIVLAVVGVLILLMGIWALIPAWRIAGVVDPSWHSWLKIVFGVVILIIAISDSKE